MSARALLFGLLAAAAVASPASACVIPPPATTAQGRAAEAQRALQRQAELDGASAVFVATVAPGSATAVAGQALRGNPPVRITLPRSDCDPYWRAGQRLVIYATLRAGRWTVLRTDLDSPAARAAVRPGAAPAPH